MRSSPSQDGELRLTLGEHLEELRGRVVRILVLYTAASVLGWFVSQPAYQAISNMSRASIPQSVKFEEVFTNISSGFFLRIHLAMLIGLVLSFPFIVLQLWGFIAPGLKPNERKPFRVIGPVSLVLFFIGAAICWSMLPAAFQFFASFLLDFPNAALFQEPGTLIFFVVKLMLAFGIGFQLPLVVFFLARADIITPNAMLKAWKQVVVLIFVGGAILTPTGDMLTLMAFGTPLVALFFGSVMAAKFSKRRGERAAELDELD